VAATADVGPWTNPGNLRAVSIWTSYRYVCPGTARYVGQPELSGRSRV